MIGQDLIDMIHEYADAGISLKLLPYGVKRLSEILRHFQAIADAREAEILQKKES